MPLPSKVRIVEKLAQLQAGFRHAFAVRPESQPLSVDDVELMERVADVIVKRGMAAPATVFLESMGPMNFLGSQALHFFTPIIECAFNVKEVEQVARLLERRDSIPRLIAVIEAKSSIVRASAQ
ncbi:MAG: hypothetical protein BVN28_06040 [Nitrospira sp. ST-bin4]|nr:MAG: hypothetical protein BVN28_06040 [Nitrospira sp. ST-bin4]